MRSYLLILCLITILTSGCVGPDVSVSNWPNGHKSAVVVTFDVEQSQPSDIDRVVTLLENHEINATFFVVAGYYDGVEGILDRLKKYEVASKGWKQSEWSKNPVVQRNSIERAHSKLVSAGFNPSGFRAPFLRVDEETLKLLGKQGYIYDSSKVGMLPFRSNGILELPLSVSYDPFWNEEVRDYLSLFYLAFERTYEKEGLFLFYTLPENADQELDTFLNYVSDKDVWITTNIDVARWWEKREKVSIEIRDDEITVHNNGPTSVSGVTLKTKKGLKILPEIAADGEVKIKI